MRTKKITAGGLRVQSARVRYGAFDWNPPYWELGKPQLSAQLLTGKPAGMGERNEVRRRNKQGKRFCSHHRRPTLCPCREPWFLGQNSKVSLARAEDWPRIKQVWKPLGGYMQKKSPLGHRRREGPLGGSGRVLSTLSPTPFRKAIVCNGKNLGFGVKMNWAQSLTLSITSCVILGKSLNFSEPYFSIQENGYNNK